MRKTWTSFSTGEVSDRSLRRYELSQVGKGLRTLINGELTRYGGIDKRPGRWFVGLAKQSEEIFLYDFEFTRDTRFILEFGPRYVRFWSNRQQVTRDDGTILELETNWEAEHLHELHFQEVRNFIYITHPSGPPQIIQRLADNDWTIRDFPATPFRDTEGRLSVADSSGTTTATATADNFLPGHVGGSLRLGYNQSGDTVTFSLRDAFNNSVLFSPNNTYQAGDRIRTNEEFDRFFTVIEDFDGPALGATSLDPSDYPANFQAGIEMFTPRRLQGRYEVATTGNWRGEWRVQESPDNINFDDSAVLFSDNSANPVASRTTDEPIYLSVIAISATDDFTDRVSVSIPESTFFSEATITAVTDARTATIEIDPEQELFGTGEAEEWLIGAWNEQDGYPRTIGTRDNRLVFAATETEPLTIWHSAIGEYENLTQGLLADSPFSISLLSEDASPIQWIATEREFFLGTSSIEGSLTSRDRAVAASVENLPVVQWFSNEGSMQRQPVFLNGALFVLQSGERRLNAYEFDFGQDGYFPSEATLIHDHILSPGAKNISISRQPEKRIIVDKRDGETSTLLFDQNAQLNGWYRSQTDGEVLSTAVVRGDGEEDEIWQAVRRGEQTCIEVSATRQTDLRREGRMNELCYLDCAFKFEGEKLTSVSGLEVHEGRTVKYLADGIVGEATVQGGQITGLQGCSIIIVGLPYSLQLTTGDVEVLSDFSNTRGNRKDLDELYLDLWQSVGGEVRDSSGKFRRIEDYNKGRGLSKDTYGTFGMRSGVFLVPVSGRSERVKTLEIRHDDPLPFTLLALQAQLTEGEI